MNRFIENPCCALRGGAWYFSYKNLSRAHKYIRFHPVNRNDYLGFRCVVPIDSVTTQRLERIK